MTHSLILLKPALSKVECWTARMRQALGPVDESGKYLFVENIPNEWCPRWPEAERRDEGLLLTPHWFVLVFEGSDA